MKINLFFLLSFTSLYSYGQIGISTDNPEATLDISAINNANNPDGLLIPRVSRGRAQNMNSVKESTLIYINNIDDGTLMGSTELVDNIGFYYFSEYQNKWIKLNSSTEVVGSDINIYDSDGNLSENRTVNLSDKTLSFISNATIGTNHFSIDENTFNIDAINNKVGIGTSSPQNPLHIIGVTQLSGPLNVGGSSIEEGYSGLPGQVLVSQGNDNAPNWSSLRETNASGTLARINYLKGTDQLNVNRNETREIPGLNYNITVPSTVASQTLSFTIVAYAVKSNPIGDGVQGIVGLYQNGNKVTSAFLSISNDYSPNYVLSNLPTPVTLLYQVTLTPGTYKFDLRYTGWSGTATINNVPSNYLGYNNDNEAMLSRMQIQVFNN